MIMVGVAQSTTYSIPANLVGDRSEAAYRMIANAHRIDWYPLTADTFDFPYVPDGIAQAAEEAHRAAQIGARMAAILMARTTVEATAKDKGITSGNLMQKIDRLMDAGLIRRPIAVAAHEIRHFGNNMAHGDIADLPNEQDVTDILALMNAVLRDVYETTAITDSIVGRRTSS